LTTSSSSCPTFEPPEADLEAKVKEGLKLPDLSAVIASDRIAEIRSGNSLQALSSGRANTVVLHCLRSVFLQ
jgi:hypothetical protein